MTVTSKGSPYAMVTMSCLSVNSVYNIDIYSDQMVGWIKDGVQVGLVPGNNVLGGLTDSASPPREAALQWGGESWELLLLAN